MVSFPSSARKGTRKENREFFRPSGSSGRDRTWPEETAQRGRMRWCRLVTLAQYRTLTPRQPRYAGRLRGRKFASSRAKYEGAQVFFAMNEEACVFGYLTAAVRDDLAGSFALARDRKRLPAARVEHQLNNDRGKERGRNAVQRIC